MKSDFWYVYIIQATDGSLYTGITTDIQRRFNAEIKKLRREQKLLLIDSHRELTKK